MKMLRQRGTSEVCFQYEHINSSSGRKAGVQHSEKCWELIAESPAATADGADRIARSELRTNRGIGPASRLDGPRGIEMVRIVADQAAGGAHTNLPAGPHRRDACVMGPGGCAAAHRAIMDVYNARRASREVRGPLQTDATTLGTDQAPSCPRRPGPSRDPGGQGTGKPGRVSTGNSPAAEPTPARADSEPDAPDEDMAFIRAIVHGEDLVTMMMSLGAATTATSEKALRRRDEWYPRSILHPEWLGTMHLCLVSDSCQDLHST